MIHNNKVYANADEKFVKNIIAYVSGNKLYKDKECTIPVYRSELRDLFLNGLVVQFSETDCAAVVRVMSNALYVYDVNGDKSYEYLATDDPVEE